MERTAVNSTLARVVGMLTFIAGVGFLILAFLGAYRLFTSAPSGLALGHSAGADPTASNLAGSALTLVKQVGMLFIMTLAGSLIAARGVQLYLGRSEKKGEGES